MSGIARYHILFEGSGANKQTKLKQCKITKKIDGLKLCLQILKRSQKKFTVENFFPRIRIEADFREQDRFDLNETSDVIGLDFSDVIDSRVDRGARLVERTPCQRLI
jgi:stress response protein SCP2